jgi:hypothetical protein
VCRSIAVEISMKLACLLVVTVALSFGRDAAAQVFVPPPPPPLSIPEIIWNSHMMQHLGNMAAGQAAFGEQLKRDLAKKNAVPSTGTGSTAPVYSSALSFPFSGTHVLATKIAEAQAGDKAALKLDELNRVVGLLWSAYQTGFREEHERLKMPINDVGTAMTYCILMSYMSYNGIVQLDAARSVAVYRQASRLFLDNPEFKKVSATDRQALAEVLVAMGGMPAMTAQMTRDQAQGRKVAENTLVNLFGKEGTRVRITENGIEF